MSFAGRRGTGTVYRRKWPKKMNRYNPGKPDYKAVHWPRWMRK